MPDVIVVFLCESSLRFFRIGYDARAPRYTARNVQRVVRAVRVLLPCATALL